MGTGLVEVLEPGAMFPWGGECRRAAKKASTD